MMKSGSMISNTLQELPPILLVRLFPINIHTFNKEAEQLIGFPMETIIPQLTEASTMTDIPPTIKNIVGKNCAFDVKIKAYNTQRGYEEYTVFRLSECLPGGRNDFGTELGSTE